MIKLTLEKRKGGLSQSIIVNENFIVKIASSVVFLDHTENRITEGSRLTLSCVTNTGWDEIVRESPDQILELINNQTLALKLQQELYGET